MNSAAKYSVFGAIALAIALFAGHLASCTNFRHHDSLAARSNIAVGLTALVKTKYESASAADGNGRGQLERAWDVAAVSPSGASASIAISQTVSVAAFPVLTVRNSALAHRSVVVLLV